MTATLGKTASCPVLVGRETALRAVVEALTSDHGPPVVRVSGEAGIGKTRLTTEAARRLGGRRPVLRVASFEADRLVPLAVFLDLLEASSAADAAELAERIAAHARREGEDRGPGAELDRRRLFDALAAALLADDRLQVVEDVHWSDPASLDALLHLARRAGSRPRLLITYRDDEVGPTLESFLAALDRARLAVDVPLTRLERDDVAAMAEAITGMRPRSAVVDRLWRLTDGNPFFVEEVLGGLGGPLDADAFDGDVPVPRTLQEAVRRRLDHLEPIARDVAAVAATAGRRFDPSLLAALLGLDDATLAHVIRQLVAANVAVQQADGTAAFRHELTRRAVYQRLLGHERRRLHARIAAAVVAPVGDPDAVAGELSHHYAHAGEWEHALAWGQRAGQRAEALYAPAAAIEHYRRAVDAAARLGVPLPIGLLQARARVCELVGELDAAIADHEAALEAARAQGDLYRMWVSLLALGGLWVARDWQRAGACLQEALTISRRLDDPVATVRTLNRQGNLLMVRGEQDRARDLHEQALAVVERLDAPHDHAATLDLLAVSTLYSGDLVAAADHYARVEQLFRSLDDQPGVANALAMRALCGGAHFLRTFVPAATDAVALAGESLRLAREVGWHGESFALYTLATVSAEAGRLGDALVHGAQALRLAEEIDHRPWIVVSRTVLGLTLLDALAPEDALPELEAAVEVAGSFDAGVFHAFALAGRARAEAALGRFDAAAASAAAATSAAPGLLSARGARHAEVAVHLAAGEPKAAFALVEALIATAPRAGDGPSPTLALLRGQALRALGDPAAPAALRRAVDVARRCGKPLVEWRALAELVGVQAHAGRAQTGADAAREAADLCDRLAAGLPASRRRQFRDRARRLLPIESGAAPGDGLTPRQREVAVLLAKGLSNRQIADALVISPHTAETHVKHILTKLGLASRAHVAAWAVEQGLTGDRLSVPGR